MSTYYANRTEPIRDHFVYRCFDAAGQLLYVGCSVRPEQRMKEHRADLKGWVGEVASMRMQGPFTYQKARQVERDALRTEYPLHGMTPQRLSAASRRDFWIKRRHGDLIAEFAVETSGPLDDYFAAYQLAAEEADRIDWSAIAERAIAQRNAA